MSDRTLISNMRFQLHDLRDDLVGVKMRTAAGARGGAIERARQHLQDAAAELEFVLSGKLEGDADGIRFAGIDQQANRR
ncbi:hypothetical protein [Sphingomonas koreensis]|uniref:hypothetical protein n=1 Tax=Sphingomonas koreensis TaxID=93064 RepID=UPI000F7E9E17|nr:hypothetical protein [Sphingomonas koreensis]MDC7808810.1 hypothetical protein [Sphingomonas koreensis]RSU98949.1 hypothetical protein CA256_03195 [Sphingomonas koreensis]